MFKIGDKIRYNKKILRQSCFARDHSEIHKIIEMRGGNLIGESMTRHGRHITFDSDEIERAKKRMG